MPQSPKVDAYIAKQPEFARPIIVKIRAAFGKASPKIEETIKWSAPAFDYNGLLAATAATKNHVALRFWKGMLMSDPDGLFTQIGKTSMGDIKLRTVKDLPTQRLLVAYIKEAMKLNADGVKSAKRSSKPIPNSDTAAPPDLAAALKLKKNSKARKTFEAFSPSNKRDYVEWLTEAKREATREKRLATTIEWLGEGKPRNWKYMKEWR